MERKIVLPLSESIVQSLKTGEDLLLTGTLYTARDAAHQRLEEYVEKNGHLPSELVNQVIYYVGPTPSKEENKIGSCGPTSSYRMDSSSIKLMSFGLIYSIGKGDRSLPFKNNLKEHQGLYLITTGGIGAKLSKCVKNASIYLFEDLGTEAIHKLEVVDFPVTVAYDTEGHSIFK